MRTAHLSKLSALLALTLAGCYAQVDDQSVSLIHDFCTPATNPCIPGASVDVSLASLVPSQDLTVDLGSSDLLSTGTTKAGPITLTSSLVVNKAVFSILGPAGADFSQVTFVELLAVTNNDDACTVASDCTTIANYDATTDGPAGTTIVLKGTGVSVIGLAGNSHQLSLKVNAKGYAPAPTLWAGSLDLDMGLSARGDYP